MNELDRRTDKPALLAHGRKYETMAAIAARITELQYLNWLHGDSDGRATEQALIYNALIDYCQKTLNAKYPTTAVHMALANQTYLMANDAPVLSVWEELKIAVENTDKGKMPVIS